MELKASRSEMEDRSHKTADDYDPLEDFKRKEVERFLEEKRKELTGKEMAAIAS